MSEYDVDIRGVHGSDCHKSVALFEPGSLELAGIYNVGKTHPVDDLQDAMIFHMAAYIQDLESKLEQVREVVCRKIINSRYTEPDYEDWVRVHNIVGL